MKVWVGIDPGLDGGIVGIRDDLGVVFAEIMPTTTHVKKSGARTSRSRTLDEPAIRRLLDTSFDRPHGPHLVTMEALTRGHPGLRGVNSALTMGINYGILRGLLSGLYLSHLLTPPKRWQKELGFTANGDTKAQSIELCQRMFPQLDLTPGQRTKPHDGLADAACLALYGLRTHGNQGLAEEADDLE